ncbi:hypothetical protein LOZ80_28730 [Paenibacillus sp. HWE-109]|uniref:hypothetical protein n=1 Tax=Paenibacillus sp. HWE-109 TaxID=1306526 RepID=UPI001EDF5A1F|nr:hypothetical protein [Paenibacillus sp. HWE-109]UKS25541.1 hypothetical protein LOZ80_28730 [Paenibacillus sp. HWE-109]
MVDLSMTLEELDGGNWGDPEQGATGLIRKCLALRSVLRVDLDFWKDNLELQEELWRS